MEKLVLENQEKSGKTKPKIEWQSCLRGSGHPEEVLRFSWVCSTYEKYAQIYKYIDLCATNDGRNNDQFSLGRAQTPLILKLYFQLFFIRLFYHRNFPK